VTALELVRVWVNGSLAAPVDPVAALASLATEGGETLRITGVNFGPALPRAYVSAVWYGSGGDSFDVTDCSLTMEHTQVRAVSVGLDRLLAAVCVVSNRNLGPATAFLRFRVFRVVHSWSALHWLASVRAIECS